MYEGGSTQLFLTHWAPTVDLQFTMKLEFQTQKNSKSHKRWNDIPNFATCGCIKGHKPYLNTLIHLGLYVYVLVILIFAADLSNHCSCKMGKYQSRSTLSVNSLSGLPHPFLMNPTQSTMWKWTLRQNWCDANDERGRKDFWCHWTGKKNLLDIQLHSHVFPVLITNHHSPPHASVLTDIDFQEITSCFIHCSKLKRMIELVAVVAEYV